MVEQSRVEIPLSKKKLVMTFLGALVFVAIGLWLVIARPNSRNLFFGNQTMVLVAGAAGVLFFGFVAVRVLPKLRDKKPGLIIDHMGITDNSSALAAGFIPWSDINEIRLMEVMNQRFLMVMVNDPELYINKATNAITKRLVMANYTSYGSPISISSHALQMDFDQLHALLAERMRSVKG